MTEGKKVESGKQDTRFPDHEKIWKKRLPEGHQLKIEQQGSDVFSLVVKRIFYSVAPEISPNSGKSLQKQIKTIEEELTFLQGPFELLEFDSLHRKALLRDKSPYRQETSTEFFEILLKEGRSFQLTRVRNQDHKNEEIPFVLPWETVDRLVEFLVYLFS